MSEGSYLELFNSVFNTMMYVTACKWSYPNYYLIVFMDDNQILASIEQVVNEFDELQFATLDYVLILSVCVCVLVIAIELILITFIIVPLQKFIILSDCHINHEQEFKDSIKQKNRTKFKIKSNICNLETAFINLMHRSNFT